MNMMPGQESYSEAEITAIQTRISDMILDADGVEDEVSPDDLREYAFEMGQRDADGQEQEGERHG